MPDKIVLRLTEEPKRVAELPDDAENLNYCGAQGGRRCGRYREDPDRKSATMPKQHETLDFMNSHPGMFQAMGKGRAGIVTEKQDPRLVDRWAERMAAIVEAADEQSPPPRSPRPPRARSRA